jgi:sporulation protein YlmC with PRC-barrel domain
MNTKKIVGILALVFSFALLGGSAFAQTYTGSYNPCGAAPSASCDRFYGAAPRFEGQYYGAAPEVQYQTSGPNVGLKSWRGYEESWLLGHEVSTPQGGVLGWVHSLVLDNCSGRVALIVLDDVPGIGHKKLAIPYNSVVKEGDNLLVFNSGSMMIASGPMGTTNFDSSPGSDPYIYTLTMGPGSSSFTGLPHDITSDWVAAVYRHYGQQPYWTEGQMPMASTYTRVVNNTPCGPVVSETQTSCGFTLSDSKAFRDDIRSSSGDVTARIHDLIIDSDGRVAFAVLSDVPGRSNALVAVPFGSLQARGDVFVFNASGDQLASAPAFSRKDMNAPLYAGNLYRFYGLQPYWMESNVEIIR